MLFGVKMRAGLLVGGLIFLVVGLGMDASVLGLIVGLPVGAIGVIMIIVGFFTSGR